MLAVQSHGERDTPKWGDKEICFGARRGFSPHPAISPDPLQPALPPASDICHGTALRLLGHQDRQWRAWGQGCLSPQRCQSTLQGSLPWEPRAGWPGHKLPQPPLLSGAARKNLPDLQDIFSACSFSKPVVISASEGRAQLPQKLPRRGREAGS